MKIKKHKLSYIYFELLLFSCFTQNITIMQIGGMALKPVHLIAAVGLFLFFKRKGHINLIVLAYVSIITIISILDANIFGIDGQLVLYLFGLLLLYVLSLLRNNISSEEVKEICRNVALLVIILIWIKNIAQFQKFILFLKNPWSGHPDVSTIIQGSINLEATWMAMFCFFYDIKSKHKWLYFMLSFLLSAVYVSRAGLIVNFLYILWLYFPSIKKLKKRTLFYICILIMLVILFLNNTDIGALILKRFTNIGDEAGSLGRTAMWSRTIPAMKKFPMGVGIGNALKALNAVGGLYLSDPNMHNIYLQNFVEIGIFGGTLYIAIVIYFIIKTSKRLLSNSFLGFIYSYLILSLIQFGGGETFIFMILGLYFNYKNVA